MRKRIERIVGGVVAAVVHRASKAAGTRATYLDFVRNKVAKNGWQIFVQIGIVNRVVSYQLT